MVEGQETVEEEDMVEGGWTQTIMTHQKVLIHCGSRGCRLGCCSPGWAGIDQ